MAPLAQVFDRVPHAGHILVTQRPHATIVEVQPKTLKRVKGLGREREQWETERCPQCGEDMARSALRTNQVYKSAPHTHSGLEKMFDNRRLPVLLHARVCDQCR